MIIKVSPAKLNGTRQPGWREDWAEPFIPRLSHAVAEGRADSGIVNTMLNRGSWRHIPRRRSLSEMDGDWN